MVAAVIRSLFSALDASRACTTSISICPSLRCPAAGAASWASAMAPHSTTSAAQARAWGKTRLRNGRFIFMFLLCLSRISNSNWMPQRFERRSKLLHPAQAVRRGLAEAVMGENPASAKKFREREQPSWTIYLWPDSAYEQVRLAFDEAEPAKLALAIVYIDAWNRIALGFRTEPGTY